MTLVLVTGGARSGKSRFAEELSARVQNILDPDLKPLYLATAEGTDSEFLQRIEIHRRRRGNRFETRETPLDWISEVMNEKENSRVILVDCLTVWLGNLFHHLGDGYLKAEERISADLEQLLSCLPLPDASSKTLKTAAFDAEFEQYIQSRKGRGAFLVLVSNELGQGLVPSDEVSRAYRDIHGRMNQTAALIATRVAALFSGIPVWLK